MKKDIHYWNDKVRYRFTILIPELSSSSHMSKDRTTWESLYFNRKTNTINRYHCRRDKWVNTLLTLLARGLYLERVQTNLSNTTHGVLITFSTSTHHLEDYLFARNVTYHVFQLYSPPTENMTLKDDGRGHNQTRQKRPWRRGEWRSFALTFCFPRATVESKNNNTNVSNNSYLYCS